MKYRDDKSYPWWWCGRVEFPRVMVGRGAKRKGTRYFGPYSHAWAIRETVDLLLRVFPMRSCSNGVFKRSARSAGRACSATSTSAPHRASATVSADEHRPIVDDFCDFMAGQTRPFIRRIEQEMYAASDALDFEKAARLRDDLGAMKRALEKQAVVLGDGTDADVIALAEDPLEVAVQIFYVRGGRIRGQRGWVADRVDEGETASWWRTPCSSCTPATRSTRRACTCAAAWRGSAPTASRRRCATSTCASSRACSSAAGVDGAEPVGVPPLRIRPPALNFHLDNAGAY